MTEVWSTPPVAESIPSKSNLELVSYSVPLGFKVDAEAGSGIRVANSISKTDSVDICDDGQPKVTPWLAAMVGYRNIDSMTRTQLFTGTLA